MKILIQIYVFLISACIGSFMNVVIDRLPLRMSIWRKRSYCMNCQKKLVWHELIPVISYLILRGKCSDCKYAIPFRIFLVELLSGCLGCFCFYQYGVSFYAVTSFLMIEILIALSIIDFQFMILPDSLVFFLGLFSIVLIYYSDLSMVEHWLGMITVPLFLIFLNFVFKESFGMGDIKLLAVCGLGIGFYKSLIVFIIAILSCGCIALYLLITRKADVKQKIPFGPFIAFSFILILWI